MSFATTISLSRALSTAALFSFYFFAKIEAQQCYYPDGSEAAGHVACSTSSDVSVCCGASSFCMDNGLCYTGGLMSRGSCTDSTWDSDQCGAYCTTVDPSTSINIMPCTATEFTCGLNATNCETNTATFTMQGGDSFVLRPSQVEALVSPALESSSSAVSAASVATVTVTAAASSTGDAQYTGGDMAGLACGIGLPLALALVAALLLLRRERQKHAPPKLMYKLPDDHEQFDPREFKPPPPLSRSASALSLGAPPSPSRAIIHPAVRSDSQASQRPFQIGGFVERYDSMKKVKIEETPLGVRHELESAPPYKNVERHELSSNRMSM